MKSLNLNTGSPSNEDPFAGLFAAIDLFSEELRVVLTILSKTETVKETIKQPIAPILRLEPPRRKNHGRVPKGVKTPAEAYFIPILSLLSEGGGRLNKTQILSGLANSMQQKFNQFDLGQNKSNQLPRWHSNVDHARRKLLSKGYLVAGANKSIWEISSKGQDWVQRRS